jgi:hypothetical protein
MGECCSTDDRNAAGDRDARQVGAVLEHGVKDERDTFGDYEAGQAGTVLEREGNDVGDAAGGSVLIWNFRLARFLRYGT